MILGNKSDFGSWKCGKGGAFTHIPTNFMILNKINSIENRFIKRGEKKCCIINVQYRKGFGSFAFKTFDITLRN